MLYILVYKVYSPAIKSHCNSGNPDTVFCDASFSGNRKMVFCDASIAILATLTQFSCNSSNPNMFFWLFRQPRHGFLASLATQTRFSFNSSNPNTFFWLFWQPRHGFLASLATQKRFSGNSGNPDTVFCNASFYQASHNSSRLHFMSTFEQLYIFPDKVVQILYRVFHYGGTEN